MGTVRVQGLGKAYKQYPTRWSRLAEWTLPGSKPRHKDVWVLRDVNFEVARGEAVGVIGANGAGKSTLLKIITGTTQPTTGSVQMEGRVAALLELGMGFHPDFTGRQNVFMAGQLLGLTQDQVATLMPQIEAFADIGYYIDQPVRIYSSGMQVRLAFSVATAVRPDLLIVDEALSVGDAHFQHKSFNRIREFQAQGTTLLLVSHDLAAVRSICNRAVWLDRGEMRAYGETMGVVDQYAASVYSHSQDIEAVREVDSTIEHPENPARATEEEDPADVRLPEMEAAGLRNDIKVFAFDRDANKWGRGDVRVAGVKLTSRDGRAVPYVMGGERVRVTVECRASAAARAVIVGFLVKDRTGQPLFGDNTFQTYRTQPLDVRAGDRLVTHFDFRMPVLPRGTYAMAAAVATGTQDEHVVEEWIDEAVFFESHNANTVQGLIGIPMHGIESRVSAATEAA